MKNFILISLIAIAGVIAFWLFRQNNALKEENKQLSEAYQASAAYNVPIDTIRTPERTIVKYLPIETTGDIGDYVSKSVADTLKDALKIATKDLKAWKSFAITLQDSLKGVNKYRDKHGIEWAELKDKTFDIRYNIDSNVWIPRVTIKPELVTYRSRKTIFSPYKYYSAILIDDPRANVSFIQDVTKIKQPSRFGIGAFGGPLVTPAGISYGVGFGLTYDIYSF